MGLFTKKTKYKEPAEWAPARKSLLEIGQTTPTFGVQGTADMTDTEKAAQGTLSNYAGGQSQEVQTALASLKDAGQYKSLTDVPEYAALLDIGNKNVNDQLNRMGRSLQLTGNTSSGSGASVMSDEIGRLNTELLGSLAPYAAEERNRRYDAPMQAANLSTTDTQQRLGAVKEYGALPREIEQLSLNAEYMSQYLNEIAPYKYQVPALNAVSQSGTARVTGGGLTDLGFATQVAGMVGAGALAGGALAGGAATSGSAATSTSMAGALSDRRMKENVEEMENPLDKVKQLTGYTYNYKFNDKDVRNGGVMAQDLEKVLPEAVEEIDGVKYVRFDATIGLLIEAVKELTQKVEGD